jgi:choline dehydrogenase-like flavoprotein
MITDFATSDPASKIKADICIIGAGAAGISAAREFIGTSVRVCLLESGDFDYDDETQDLYEGTSNHQNLTNSRLRYFGGTTNHFVGESSPLDEIDFQKRDWVPHSGWPMKRKDLDPYYRRAHEVMELGPYAYGKAVWEALRTKPHNFDEERFKTYFVQYSGRIKEGYWDWKGPVRFGEAYRKELKAADNVQVLINANVTDIRPNTENSHIENVTIQSLNGAKSIVSAKAYVIACGGIESARILLNSTTRSPRGVGNEHGLVGRFFGSHPYANIGTMLAKDPEQMANLYSRFKKFGTAKTRPCLRLSESIQKSAKALNISVYLTGEDDMESGVGAATEAWRQIKQWDFDENFAKQLWAAMADIDEVGAQYFRAQQGKDVIIPVKQAINLWAICEWAPYADSRVVLSDEKDALGLRRVHVNDRISALELHTFKTAAMTVATELSRLGLGRVHLDEWILSEDDRWKDAVTLAGAHHFGTTRMAASPKNGVVDADCKVHSMANLYIASSAVFPTNGYANPTISIVALALRLSDHLKEKFS